MNLHRHFYPVAGIFAILTAASLGSGHAKTLAAASNPLNVVVTNSSSNPVPVAPQGTTNVAVTNQPTVNLANSASSPVPVQDVDIAARTPVTIFMGVNLPENDTEDDGVVDYIVPSGKRLVVQTVISSTFQFPGGEKLVEAGISQVFGVRRSIPVQDTGKDFDGFEHITGAFTGILYYDSGAQLRAYAVRDKSTGEGQQDLILTGYLENATGTTEVNAQPAINSPK